MNIIQKLGTYILILEDEVNWHEKVRIRLDR